VVEFFSSAKSSSYKRDKEGKTDVRRVGLNLGKSRLQRSDTLRRYECEDWTYQLRLD
jgi:hypothetical protein